MFIHPKFVYKPKNFPKFQSFLFFKNTPKYDKLSKNYQYFYKNNARTSDKVQKLRKLRKFRTYFGWTSETILHPYWMLQSDWLRALVHSLYWIASRTLWLSLSNPFNHTLNVGRCRLIASRGTSGSKLRAKIDHAHDNKRTKIRNTDKSTMWDWT